MNRAKAFEALERMLTRDESYRRSMEAYRKLEALFESEIRLAMSENPPAYISISRERLDEASMLLSVARGPMPFPEHWPSIMTVCGVELRVVA